MSSEVLRLVCFHRGLIPDRYRCGASDGIDARLPKAKKRFTKYFYYLVKHFFRLFHFYRHSPVIGQNYNESVDNALVPI